MWGAALQIGDLILASEEIYGDEGAMTSGGFLDMESLGFPLAEAGGERWFNRFPADPELLGRNHRLIAAQAGAGRRWRSARW